jgi:hypothetical protein
VAILVILVLGILWAAVLIPPILRSRSEAGAAPAGVGDFVARLRSGLGAGAGRSSSALMHPLQPIVGPLDLGGPDTPLGPVQVPGSMTPTQRRRRDVLIGLLAAVVLTFLMAVMAGSIMFWVLHLLADGVLGGYVYLLLQFKARKTERTEKVRPLAGQPTGGVISNVTPFARRRYVGAPSLVEAPGEATVLALRRAGSW